MWPRRAVQVRDRLGVHDQQLAAGLDVLAEPAASGVLHHQVGLERHGRRGAGRPRSTSGPKVRLGTNWPSITSHWMRSTPGLLERRALLAEPGEVGRQHRRERSRCGRSRAIGHRHPTVPATRSLAPGADCSSCRPRDGGRRRGGRPGSRRRVVFVAGALPGRAGARRGGRASGSDFARAVLVEVVDAVARSGRAAVPVRGRGLRRLRLAARRRRPASGALKAQIVAEALRRAGGLADAARRRRARARRRRASAPPSRRGGRRAGRLPPRRAATTSVAVDALPGRPPAAGRAARRRPLRRGRRGRAALLARHRRAAGRGRHPTGRREPPTTSAAPTSLVGPATRWFHEEVAGRRWRISATLVLPDPRPTAPRRWSTPCARGGRRRRRRADGSSTPTRGVGPVRRHACRCAGRSTLVERARPRRAATPGTTWPAGRRGRPGRRRPAGARRRPTSWWPTRRDRPRRRRRPTRLAAHRRAPASCWSSCDPASLGRDAAAARRPRLPPRPADAGRPVPAHPPRRGRDRVRSRVIAGGRDRRVAEHPADAD